MAQLHGKWIRKGNYEQETLVSYAQNQGSFIVISTVGNGMNLLIMVIGLSRVVLGLYKND